MINEEKVIMMTKLASYEQGEGKKNIKVGNYFREDYLTLQILKSVIYSTISFVLIFALYVFYNFETFMSDVYKTDIYATGKKILLYYLFFVFVYSIVAAIVYNKRYSKARKKLKKYYNNLKKLYSYYND